MFFLFFLMSLNAEIWDVAFTDPLPEGGWDSWKGDRGQYRSTRIKGVFGNFEIIGEPSNEGIPRSFQANVPPNTWRFQDYVRRTFNAKTHDMRLSHDNELVTMRLSPPTNPRRLGEEL